MHQTFMSRGQITTETEIPLTTESPMISHRKERFAEATADVTHYGFNFFITVGDVIFSVRHYDDLPGVSTIISPKTARQLPQARLLVDYLGSALGRSRTLFYDGSSDTYREVDVRTLDFKLFEACATSPAD
jgi:hypothetical protein